MDRIEYNSGKFLTLLMKYQKQIRTLEELEYRLRVQRMELQEFRGIEYDEVFRRLLQQMEKLQEELRRQKRIAEELLLLYKRTEDKNLRFVELLTELPVRLQVYAMPPDPIRFTMVRQETVVSPLLQTVAMRHESWLAALAAVEGGEIA